MEIGHSLISGSFFTIFLLNIGLISTFNLPPRLACYLIRALSNLGANVRIFWKFQIAALIIYS